jgi:hypothetical protein
VSIHRPRPEQHLYGLENHGKICAVCKNCKVCFQGKYLVIPNKSDRQTWVCAICLFRKASFIVKWNLSQGTFQEAKVMRTLNQHCPTGCRDACRSGCPVLTNGQPGCKVEVALAVR